MAIELFKSFVAQMADYIARHNGNYALIESTLNLILSQLTGQSGGLAVPYGLQEIFDRRGLIGVGSYDFNAGVLSGPDYNFTVQAGAYYNAGTFYHKAGTSILSMAGKATGTYYLNLDAAGNPLVASGADGSTTRQFAWDSSTHTISAKALYTGVSILFDGDDYADMLTSAARAKTFTKVADRLEELEGLVADMSGFYAWDHTTGLDVYYKAGKCRDADSQIHNTAAGHVTCTNEATNYIECDPATGTVSVNQTAFTSGKIPLFVAIAAGGAITTLTDNRTWACVGGGGGGGGHAQNTDTGTTASEFGLDTDATGNPTGRVGLKVFNGDNPAAFLKFNRDTGKWEYSEDGGDTWKNFGQVELDLGTQELCKYVPFQDPPLALEDLERDSSVAYELLDLSTLITAPLGVAAVAIRVQFWDSTPGPGTNALFRKAGIGEAPAIANTVWADQLDPATLLIPVSDALALEYFINASGAGAANIRVFLAGYLEKVTGVGTQDTSFSHAGMNVGAGTSATFNLTGFLNRGLCHYFKVQETGEAMTGTYDLHLYARDTFLAGDLLYKLEDVNPAAAYEDWLPFWLQDRDESHELHIKIINNDEAEAGVFSISLNSEQFA